MTSLAGLLASALATALWYVAVLRRRGAPIRSGPHELVFIALYALTLLLALRFGARTYPGVYVPASAALNWILNGTALFTAGYGLVVLGALLHAASLMRTAQASPSGSLRAWSLCFVSLAVCISVYGFYFAGVLGRLPA